MQAVEKFVGLVGYFAFVSLERIDRARRCGD